MTLPLSAADLASYASDAIFVETVTSVDHYTDRLFRFRMTRPSSFRFRSGEFAMIGLLVDGKPARPGRKSWNSSPSRCRMAR